ncbi:Mad2 [Operophtera brumata]|uniref:Mad2 n=1 Tax=Operophtera brumata TaxID=104452 RepID=A0A0L7K3I4_OPEBR|nr:Mad2 [Operophtera brumata]
MVLAYDLPMTVLFDIDNISAGLRRRCSTLFMVLAYDLPMTVFFDIDNISAGLRRCSTLFMVLAYDLPMTVLFDIDNISAGLRRRCSTLFMVLAYDLPMTVLCSFDVLVHAKTDCDVPDQWAEAEPIAIVNAQNVQLKSFSTNLHKMETVVSYKLVD